MKNLNKILNLTCWGIMCFLLFPITESKAQVIKMSAEDLTKKSTAVLYGKCSKLKSEWNADRKVIYTNVTIIPEEYIKGNLGSEAIITVPGGRVDDIIYEVSEMPVFTEGEDVVAFIWTNARGKNLVTGGYQGKVKIEQDNQTGKRMVQANTMTEVPGQTMKAERMQLEDFVIKLKGYAKN